MEILEDSNSGMDWGRGIRKDGGCWKGDSGRWDVDGGRWMTINELLPVRPPFRPFPLGSLLVLHRVVLRAEAGGCADAERWTCITGCPFKDLSSQCRRSSDDARSSWGPRTGCPGGLGMARQPFKLDWASPRRCTSIISLDATRRGRSLDPAGASVAPVHPQHGWDMYQVGR